MTAKVEGSSADLTRSSLLDRARRQDSDAWSELVELYEPLVVSWCRRCGLDVHQTADCTQDVFAAVAGSLDRFQPTRTSGSFRGWLWTITANKIRDALRREQRHPEPGGGSTALRNLHQIGDPAGHSSMDANPERAEGGEPTEHEDINDLVARAMAQIRDEFAPRTWKIFDRSVIDGVSTAQIAEEFTVSSATVRQTRSRILRRLRRQLGDIDS